MKLSFTLDEKIFEKISPQSLIEKASMLGISSLELSPDTDVLSLETYKNILNIASYKNMNLNYHVPYFANEIYELEHFCCYEDKLKDKYLSFLNLLELFQENLSNKPSIVIHGANYNEGEKLKSMDNTLRFLDWMLNTVAKRNLPFNLAIETLRKKELRNTLDNREDILFIIDNFKSNNLKICWDMCHDKLNFFPKDTPNDESFFKHVVYSHIHGHNLEHNASHISLAKSDLDYSVEIDKLKKANFKESVNIELLSSCSQGTYLEDLFKDIDYMNNLI